MPAKTALPTHRWCCSEVEQVPVWKEEDSSCASPQPYSKQGQLPEEVSAVSYLYCICCKIVNTHAYLDWNASDVCSHSLCYSFAVTHEYYCLLCPISIIFFINIIILRLHPYWEWVLPMSLPLGSPKVHINTSQACHNKGPYSRYILHFEYIHICILYEHTHRHTQGTHTKLHADNCTINAHTITFYINTGHNTISSYSKLYVQYILNICINDLYITNHYISCCRCFSLCEICEACGTPYRYQEYTTGYTQPWHMWHDPKTHLGGWILLCKLQSSANHISQPHQLCTIPSQQ